MEGLKFILIAIIVNMIMYLLLKSVIKPTRLSNNNINNNEDLSKNDNGSYVLIEREVLTPEEIESEKDIYKKEKASFDSENLKNEVLKKVFEISKEKCKKRLFAKNHYLSESSVEFKPRRNLIYNSYNSRSLVSFNCIFCGYVGRVETIGFELNDSEIIDTLRSVGYKQDGFDKEI